MGGGNDGATEVDVKVLVKVRVKVDVTGTDVIVTV